jgi:CHASE3 domain sensor protein
MELYSAEDSRIVRSGFGLALVILCLVIAFSHAHIRSLTKIGDSLTSSLVVVDHVDSVLNDLDRLSVDQRAFLSTGDDHFSQDVAESAIALSHQVNFLNVLVAKKIPLQAPVAKLALELRWALNAVGRSYDIQEMAGSAAAIAYLDTDPSIFDAKLDAEQLRSRATDSLFDRVRAERRVKAIMEVLF